MEKNVSLGKQLQFVNLKRLVLTLFLFPPPAPSPERLGRWGRGTLVEVRGGSAATAREERAKPLPAQPRSLKAAEPPCPSERRAGPLGGARDSQDCSSKKTEEAASQPGPRNCFCADGRPEWGRGPRGARGVPSLPEAARGALGVFAGSACAHPSLASHGPVRGHGHSSEQSCWESCGLRRAAPSRGALGRGCLRGSRAPVSSPQALGPGRGGGGPPRWTPGAVLRYGRDVPAAPAIGKFALGLTQPLRTDCACRLDDACSDRPGALVETPV